MQDIGTASGPSNSLLGGGIRLSDWHSVGGGETGFTVPDPTDPNIVYAGEYGGYIIALRPPHAPGPQHQHLSVQPVRPRRRGPALSLPVDRPDPDLAARSARRSITRPTSCSSSTDGGQTWKPISGDLTRNDKSKQKWSGGPITGDNTGVEVYGTIFAIAESPREEGPALGRQRRRPGPRHRATAARTGTTSRRNEGGCPSGPRSLCIEPSPFDADTAYVVVDNHRLDDMRPYLFKTTDGGKTWKKLSDGAAAGRLPARRPRGPEEEGPALSRHASAACCSRRDAGDTLEAVEAQSADGAVTDLVVKDNDLVVGTNGRSIWIFDDLTPIRDWSAEIAAKDAILFPVKPAVPLALLRVRFEEGIRRGAGQNPPPGPSSTTAQSQAEGGDHARSARREAERRRQAHEQGGAGRATRRGRLLGRRRQEKAAPDRGRIAPRRLGPAVRGGRGDQSGQGRYRQPEDRLAGNPRRLCAAPQGRRQDPGDAVQDPARPARAVRLPSRPRRSPGNRSSR